MFKLSKKQLLIAAAVLVTPSMAVAQEEVTDQANEVAEQARELAQQTNELTSTVAEQSGANDRDGAAARTDDRGDRADGDREDDDSGKWGLLGLLGLAGLLGLKRRDDHRDRHVHVDSDRDRGSRL
jgi:MYXO-CTERM domain-containing protein